MMTFFLKVGYFCKTSGAKHLPHGTKDLCWLYDLFISERELVITHVAQISSSIFLLILLIRNKNKLSLPSYF